MNMLCACAHFIIKICEKSSPVDDFQYDLIMILDSGLLFLGHPVYYMSSHFPPPIFH